MPGTPVVRALVAGVLLVLAWTPGAGSAGATMPVPGAGFEACASSRGVLCRYVSVPLDYANETRGELRLLVTERLPRGVSRGTILLLAGGPGEASTRTFDLTSKLWRRLFPGYTVAAYDNRGTGGSSPLTCPAAAGARRCAQALGSARVFYGTRENAEDVESVRRALGVDTIALFGISYGTRQALAYAAAYPERVERLLLDSAVSRNGPDPLGLVSLRAIRGALDSICHGNVCGKITSDPARDVARLANRLAAAPLVAEVPVYTNRWTPTSRHVRVDGLGLLSLVRASDLNTGVAIALPAAVRSALDGRPALLARLAALVQGEGSSDTSRAVFLATTCADGPFSWGPGTPVADRRSELDRAVAELPRGSLGRFGRWAASAGSAECLGWPPPTGSDAPDTRPLPDVPVLVLAGDRDLRTPLEAGAAVAARFPRGRLLVAPGVGHTVVASSSCVDGAIATWMAGGKPPSRCPRARLPIAPVGLVPRRVAAADAQGPGKGVVARTLGATLSTLRSAEAAWLTSYPSGWVVGLEGGLLAGENFDVFRFSAFSDVPGLAVSGRLTFSVSARGELVAGSEHGIVQVGGRHAANGFLQVRNRRIFGILGGRQVSSRF